MSAKSFIRTPEMQAIFVFKEKFNCTMKKKKVSMATVLAVLKHGGDHISNVTYPRLLNMVSF